MHIIISGNRDAKPADVPPLSRPGNKINTPTEKAQSISAFAEIQKSDSNLIDATYL